MAQAAEPGQPHPSQEANQAEIAWFISEVVPRYDLCAWLATLGTTASSSPG